MIRYFSRVVLCLFAAVLWAQSGWAQSAPLSHSSNLREKPTIQSAILSTLNSGDNVTVLSPAPSGGYLNVRTADGKEGWVLAKNVVVAGRPILSARAASKAPPMAAAPFVPACSDPTFPSGGGPTTIDSECPIQGTGGKEGNQNMAKNNFCATGPATAVTVADMIALQRQVQADKSIPFGSRSHPFSAQAGPAVDRSALEQLGEGQEIVLTGFVKISRAESAETVNCELGKTSAEADVHDIHISIVPTAGAAECTGVVAEMIPHHRPAAWTPALVNQVAASKRQVRVTGNRMFDSSHSPCKAGVPISGDPSRASLWEVHPIYKFEVCNTSDCSSGEGFVPLEEWKPE